MKPTAFPRLEQTKTKTELQQWINKAVKSLPASETPFLEVQVIAGFILGHSREWLISHPEFVLSSAQIEKLAHAVDELRAGKPLAYITGQRAFYGLDFKVNPNVLIPRPETELLVGEAIRWLQANPRQRRVVDVGTGSGIIAVTIANTISDAVLTGIDISGDALYVARENAAHYLLADRIVWIQNDLLDGIKDSFDLVLSNLPYIPTKKLDALEVIKFEPRLALDGGEDGVELIRRLLHQCRSRLNPNGAILLEIEATLNEEVMLIAEELFPSSKIDLLFDYANLPRLVKIYK